MNDSNPFRITGGTPEPRFLGAPVDEADRAAPALERVEKLVTSANVFLFMKGVPEQPQCGFSANTVAILETIGIPYKTFDILSDESIRAAAKQFAGWPTFPQLWVGGEFIGGNDIMVEMYQTDELVTLVKGASE